MFQVVVCLGLVLASANMSERMGCGHICTAVAVHLVVRVCVQERVACNATYMCGVTAVCSSDASVVGLLVRCRGRQLVVVVLWLLNVFSFPGEAGRGEPRSRASKQWVWWRQWWLSSRWGECCDSSCFVLSQWSSWWWMESCRAAAGVLVVARRRMCGDGGALAVLAACG